jgi:4-amino-4-deoxy-L-arabinose transferase-like glycosyltransferase
MLRSGGRPKSVRSIQRSSRIRETCRVPPVATLIERVFARRWPTYLALFALALALRLVWVVVVDRNGFPFNDTLHYHVTARSLADGRGYQPLFGGPTARWPPGYTTVLAGVYWVFGPHPIAGEVLNAVLGALTVVLGMLLVDRTVGWSAAVVSGSILALLPGPILWTDLLLSETLFVAMFVVLYLVLMRAEPTWRWMMVIGLVIGLGVMVRGEALTWLLLPVVAFWSALPKLELVKRVGAALVVVLVVMTPWTVRNALVMDAFVPVSTNASQTLWAGHSPDATGGQVYPSRSYLAQFPPDPPEFELESATAMRRDAIEYMVTHPLRELELIPLKLLHLNRGDSYALDWVNQVREGQAAPVSVVNAERIGVVADAAYYGLLVLTILAAMFLGRGFWGSRLGRCMVTSFVTALVLYGFVYYGNYRYRLPYEPLMVIAAATLIMRLWHARSAIGAERVS